MKKIIFIFAFWVIIQACKKTDDTSSITPTVKMPCRITQMITNKGTYDFVYGSDGNITKYTLTNLVGSDKQVLTNSFGYNASNQLTSAIQSFTINGKDQGGNNVGVFTYSSGLLTGISYTAPGGTTAFASTFLKYDANKRLIESNYINTSSKFSSIDKYEYDANGNCTKNLSIASDKSTFEVVNTYDSSKNPEQILAKILPYDFATSQPWKNNVALTYKETFNDGAGFIDVLTGKRTNIKTSANAYVNATTFTDGNNGVINESYALADCN